MKIQIIKLLLKIEQVHSQKRERTYSSTDYQLTIEMAKEICMIQRSEKGLTRYNLGGD